MLFNPNIPGLKKSRDVARLIRALKSKAARTRREAIKALGEIGARQAMTAITQVLSGEATYIEERIEAAAALGELGDDATIPLLLAANEASKSREQTLIAAAFALPDRQYRGEYYINQISADESLLRSTLATALGKIGGPRAIQALFEMLASEKGAMESATKNKIKAALRDASGKNGEESVPLLRNQLKHESEDVRHAATDCLGELGGEQAILALLGVALNEAEAFLVRQAALFGLGRIGDARAIPYLEDLMDSADRALKRDAMQTAAAIRQRIKPAPEI